MEKRKLVILMAIILQACLSDHREQKNILNTATTENDTVIDIKDIFYANRPVIEPDKHLNKDIEIYKTLFKDNQIYSVIFYRLDSNRLRGYQVFLANLTDDYSTASYKWENDYTLIFKLRNTKGQSEEYTMQGYGGSTGLSW